VPEGAMMKGAARVKKRKGEEKVRQKGIGT
jgi:hypothetical protein